MSEEEDKLVMKVLRMAMISKVLDAVRDSSSINLLKALKQLRYEVIN